MILTPKSEIKKRIDDFQKSLLDSGFDGALIYQNVDLFYYTGTLQNGALYVPSSGEPLFMVIKNIDRARTESPIEKIVRLTNPVKAGEILNQNGYTLTGKLGLEMDVIPAKLYAKLLSTLGCELDDISMSVRIQRSVKSEFEIGMMKKSAGILKKVFAAIPDMLEENITETEISARIEYELRKHGSQGVLRMRAFGMELYAAHLAFGKSSATPVHFDGPVGVNGMYSATPQIGGDRKLKPGMPILADIVAGYGGYHIDCTRAFAYKHLDDKYIKAHMDALKLNKLIISRMKPGAIPSEIYDETIEMARNLGYESTFMSSGENQVKFVAHGIGLEVDEIPVIARSFKTPLAEGITMAVEPKIIDTAHGGVGVENTYLITAKGVDCFTNFDMELVIV